MNENKKDKEKISLKSKNNDFSFIDKNNTHKFNNKNNSKLLKNTNSFDKKIKETNNQSNNKSSSKNLQKRLLKEEVNNDISNQSNVSLDNNTIINKNNNFLDNNINLHKKESILNNTKYSFDNKNDENIENFNVKNNINKNEFNLKSDINVKENFSNINKNDFNLKEHINIKDDFSNKLNKDTEKEYFKDFTKKEYSKEHLKENNINIENSKNKESKEKYINLEDKNVDEKLNFSNKEKSKSKENSEDLKEEKEPTINELKTDLKNLNIEARKNGLVFKKSILRDKIRKNYTLQFREVREVPNKDNTETILKTKIIFPRIKEKGFQYNDSAFRKGIYRLDDLTRGKFHREVAKSEDDNTTIKATHFLEKNIERNFVSFIRNSNYRKIKKYNKLEKKISSLENKQVLNNLKLQFKDSKTDYKKAVKNLRQKNAYKKMMMNKINKANVVKRVQNTVSNILAFKSSPLTLLLSLKGALIGIVIFLVIFLMSFFSLFFSSLTQGVGDIYEIQKAELYYREMEAKIEYNNGKRINHNPIDLSSFLITNFGEFIFDENMKKILEELIKTQYLENKSLRKIIEENLTPEQFTYFLELYQNKGGYMRYGSPFQVEYEPRITSYIGYRINPTSSQTELQLHKGLDIGMGGGTPIIAISNGTVTRANFSSSFGNIVEIRHEDGYLSKYAHQQRLNVTKGQKIKQGDIIGFVGTTGDSTGNHLHLELYDENGEFMNPIFFIARNNKNIESDNNGN